jgi:hypothetical protein
MSTGPEVHDVNVRPEDEAVEAMLAFLPIHKRAMGVACGIVGGSLLFLATAFALMILGGDATGLRLVGEFFFGYEVSWVGAFIGFFWGFVTCFVFAWFAAFVHNFAVATYIFLLRTREELRQTRDFLDHI